MNISEGVRADVVGSIGDAAGVALLDVHSDPWHHRSVLTLGGAETLEAAEAVAAAAVRLLDLDGHVGAHPRLGVVDVVPFVPLGVGRAEESLDLGPARAARDAFGRWAGSSLGLPCFFYGPERSLPEVRRGAFVTLAPDTGPAEPHPSAGAVCVGARPALVAYNLWLESRDLALARTIARAIRCPEIRALGLGVGDRVQVSCNLVDPWQIGPGALFDAVDSLARVERAELVGLVPEGVLAREPRRRWSRLDLDAERTIESRLASRRP
ncbi:MAG: Formiminotransferase domain protein [Acidimicrobiaceae bacterium]|nr:Formiminotransferase domain protein [Acidimicrobiaceae bacterium]